MSRNQGGLGVGVALASLLFAAATVHAAPKAARHCEVGSGTLDALGQITGLKLTYKRVGKAAYRRPSGVRVQIAPEVGMNAPLLLQRARCLSAVAKDEHPLAMEGLTLRVQERGSRFELQIETENVADAREVMRRLQAQHGAL